MTVGLGTGSTAASSSPPLACDAERTGDLRGDLRGTADLARSAELRLVDLDARVRRHRPHRRRRRRDRARPGPDQGRRRGAAAREAGVGGVAPLRGDRRRRQAGRPGFGRFPLPIEVVAFGHRPPRAAIVAAAADARRAASPACGMQDGAPLVTDGGNLIYDLPCGAIDDPAALAAALKALTGVVEHGLFLGLADEALIGDRRRASRTLYRLNAKEPPWPTTTTTSSSSARARAACGPRGWRRCPAPRSPWPRSTGSAAPASSAAACPRSSWSTPASSPATSRRPRATAGRCGEPSFDWPTFRDAKDMEIARLSGIYVTNLHNAGADLDPRPRRARRRPHPRAAPARTSDRHRRQDPDRHRRPARPARRRAGHRARHHLRTRPSTCRELPKRMLIVGGGYIAVEFACIFNGLGVETTLRLPRRQHPARLRRRRARPPGRRDGEARHQGGARLPSTTAIEKTRRPASSASYDERARDARATW